MTGNGVMRGKLTIGITSHCIPNNGDIIHGMTRLNRSNAYPMASSATVFGKDEIIGIVDSKTVILVDYCATAANEGALVFLLTCHRLCQLCKLSTHVIVKSVEEETSKPSVLCPNSTPSALSYVTGIKYQHLHGTEDIYITNLR